VKRKLLRLWSIIVRAKYNNQCAVCGSAQNVQAHHLIHKAIQQYKFDVNNGIALCCKHHLFDFKISAHKGSYMFFEFLKENYKKVFEQYVMNIHNIEKVKLDIEQIEKELLKEYSKYVKESSEK